MTFRLFALLFTLYLSGFSMLHAQDCYQKALQKGDKLYQKGEHDKAREAWEKGKQCPGADVAKLDMKIRKMDDFDLDGVPNKLDQCFYEFGAKETNGCPCADAYRWLGIDNYYDNQPDSAMMHFSLAKKCSDASNVKDIAVWESKVAAQKFAKLPTEQPDNGILRVVDEKPDFPGGEMAMLQFIYNNIRYPAFARENGVEGTVYVNFVIEKDGYISHIKVIRDVGAGLGQEAARVIKTMPTWKPVMMDGKPVRVYFNLPVKYKLQ